MLMQLSQSCALIIISYDTYLGGASIISRVRAGTVTATTRACDDLIGTTCITLLLILEKGRMAKKKRNKY
jgi:hypothetical protein